MLIAILRSGHHNALPAYLHRLDFYIGTVCLTYKEEHTPEHWQVTCPAGD